MPTPNVDTGRIQALLGEAAEAAAGNLASGLASGLVGDGTEPMEFVPGEGAVAIAADTTGLNGTLVMVLSSELVTDVLNGPAGAQGIVAAVGSALRSAAMVLDQAAPRALRLDEFREVPANEMFAGAADAWWFGAAPLFRGEEHRASLALFLTDPALASTDDAESDAAATLVESVEAHLYSPPHAPQDRAEMPSFDPFAGETQNAPHPLRLLHDVEMELTVELGRTKMAVRHILGLTPGSVIELDRAAGSPVDLFVNGTLIGRGEVVVIDEEFGVRIAEIVGRPVEE